MTIAAVDIGSNAIRLLVKDTENPDFLNTISELRATDYYERVPLKSGIDVFAYGNIQPNTERVLTDTMCRFARIMRSMNVAAYRVCATSAYRDALNGSQVALRAGIASGLDIEIISGEEEARITRLSYIPPREWSDDTFLFVDVGGGSTELSVVRHGQLHYGHSFQIGSMRYVCGNQSSEEELALDRRTEEIFRTYPRIHYLGVGGCVSFMKQYLNGSHGSDTILVSEMQTVYEDLRTLTVDEIVSHYSIPRERADILTPASSVFLRIAANLNTQAITVPSIGVRNGIITELYRKTL